jgi:hypothetical protein
MERLTDLAADALEERCERRDKALLRARVLTGGIHELIYDSLARGQVKGISELAAELVASHLSSEVVHGG